jgi:hypothetical protein
MRFSKFQPGVLFACERNGAYWRYNSEAGKCIDATLCTNTEQNLFMFIKDYKPGSLHEEHWGIFLYEDELVVANKLELMLIEKEQ